MAEQNKTFPIKKDGRGKLLTIILLVHSLIAVLFFVVLFQGLLSLIFMHGSHIELSNANLPANILGIAIVIIVITSAVLMWKWSKLGVYGLILLFFLWLVEYFAYELPHYIQLAKQTNTPLTIIIGQTIWFYIAFSSLYFSAIKSKWNLFT